MKTFAAAINCMDGRVQEPVTAYLKKNFEITYVDMITEAGPDKILSEEQDGFRVNSIKQRVDISVKQHGAKIILVAGHHDCAGNPVDKETHVVQTLNSAARIKKWFPDVEVIPVWINENWEVEPI